VWGIISSPSGVCAWGIALASHVLADFAPERVLLVTRKLKKCAIFDDSAKAGFHESRVGWQEYMYAQKVRELC